MASHALPDYCYAVRRSIKRRWKRKRSRGFSLLSLNRKKASQAAVGAEAEEYMMIHRKKDVVSHDIIAPQVPQGASSANACCMSAQTMTALKILGMP
jgi:hypothetical protein